MSTDSTISVPVFPAALPVLYNLPISCPPSCCCQGGIGLSIRKIKRISCVTKIGANFKVVQHVARKNVLTNEQTSCGRRQKYLKVPLPEVPQLRLMYQLRLLPSGNEYHRLVINCNSSLRPKKSASWNKSWNRKTQSCCSSEQANPSSPY